MAELILSPGFLALLFALSLLFTFLALQRRTLPPAVLAALSAIALCLLGLAAGQTLERLLLAILAPTAMVLFSQTGREEGGE